MKLLTVSEAAQALGVSRATVWRWLREGRFGDPMRSGFGATSPYKIRFADFARVAADLAAAGAVMPASAQLVDEEE